MSVHFVEVRTVRIVCDAILKDHVLKDVIKLGANGYTWGNAQGTGEHDFNGETFTGPERVWVDVWCDIPLSEKIVIHFKQAGFHDLAIVVGVQPIWVPQDDAHKFTTKRQQGPGK
jgi:hypothetical protein